MITVQQLHANKNAFTKAQAVNARVYKRANNFQVAGNGDIYEVSVEDGNVSCTCKAAQFDRACYHAAAVITLIEAEWEAVDLVYIAEFERIDAARREQEAAAEEFSRQLDAECDKQEADALFFNSLSVEQETAYCDALVAAHEQWEPGYDRPRCVNYIN